MPSAKPAKRAGFFCELPLSVIATIKKRSSAAKPQWVVIQEAIVAHKPKALVAKKPSK